MYGASNVVAEPKGEQAIFSRNVVLYVWSLYSVMELSWLQRILLQGRKGERLTVLKKEDTFLPNLLFWKREQHPSLSELLHTVHGYLFIWFVSHFYSMEVQIHILKVPRQSPTQALIKTQTFRPCCGATIICPTFRCVQLEYRQSRTLFLSSLLI